MQVRKLVCLLAALLLGSTTFAQKAAAPAPAKPKPAIALVPGMGEAHHAVSTKDAMAQKFFDQGMAFIYGFNHDQAEKSFRRAGELDSKLAMAHWGIAKAVGPNYNLPVDPEREKQAYDEIQKARELAQSASRAERDYIEALAHRFTKDQNADLKQLDSEYSDAMRSLTQKYP